MKKNVPTLDESMAKIRAIQEIIAEGGLSEEELDMLDKQIDEVNEDITEVTKRKLRPHKVWCIVLALLFLALYVGAFLIDNFFLQMVFLLCALIAGLRSERRAERADWI